MALLLQILGAISLCVGILIGLFTLSERFRGLLLQFKQRKNMISYFDNLGGKR
jgi:hypothetical protein